MKWLMVVVVLAGAGFWGYRFKTQRAAEDAVVASVCAREITDDVVANLEATRAAMNRGGSVLEGASFALKRKQIYAASSLAPHLGAIQRTGDLSIPRFKELAVVAASRCPDVFPESIAAEKPLAIVWAMAIDLPE